jgi:hypothetical protein
MKTARFLFLMIIGPASLQGTSFAVQSIQAPEQTLSESHEKPVNDRSPDVGKDRQTGGEKDQTGKYLDENQKSFAAVKGGAPKRRPVEGHAKPAPSHQRRSGKTPAANDPRSETVRNVLDSHQTSSTRSSDVPDKTLKHSSVPVPPPTVALNGQQFKNSRDPGARMATSGGPANSMRGTVINGTDIKHKP